MFVVVYITQCASSSRQRPHLSQATCDNVKWNEDTKGFHIRHDGAREGES